MEIIDVEEAKSARSGCKSCRQQISKGDLRVVVLIETPSHQGFYCKKCGLPLLDYELDRLIKLREKLRS